jgi:hypothetical protein
MKDIENNYVISRYSGIRGEYTGTTSTNTPYDTLKKFKASDAGASDSYGGAVEIRGNTAVVSAHGWDDPLAEGGFGSAGAIYCYIKTGTSWVPRTEHILTSSVRQNNSKIGTAGNDAETSYRFNALTVHGERVVAGVPEWYNGSIYPGQIVIWEKSGDIWVESHVTASTSVANDWYGLSVSTYGDHIAVGAPYHDGKNTNAGKVYILSSGSAGWVEETTLEPEYGAGIYDEYGAYFGISLHMNSDLLAVGVPGKDKTHVYRSGSLGWVEEEILTHPSSSTGDKYGSNVAIDGQVLVVGCPYEDAAGANAGAAFVYTSSSATGWDFAQGILHTAADGVSNVEGSRLGSSVDVDSGNIIVGAPYYDALSGAYAETDGVAYLYISGSTGWLRSKTFSPDDPQSAVNPGLGTGVSISGDTLMVGSYNEDGEEASSGVAYVYEPAAVTTIVDAEPTYAKGAMSTFNIRKQSSDQYLKTTLK